MLTHSNFIAMMSAVADIVPFNNDVYFSYLPLAHSLERVAFDAMMGNGCAIGFYQGVHFLHQLVLNYDFNK